MKRGVRRTVADQDRHHRMRAAIFVEVEQIQAVIFHLPQRRGAGLGALEFQYQDGAVGQHHRIDAASQTQHRVFQKHPPCAGARDGGQGLLQRQHAVAPGGRLFRIGGAEVMHLPPGKLAQHGVHWRRYEVAGLAGPEGGHAS